MIKHLDIKSPGAPYEARLSWTTMAEGNMHEMQNRQSAVVAEGLSLVNVTQPHLRHGTDIIWIDEHNRSADYLYCDGLSTGILGITLSVHFADCPSVVLFDPEYGTLVLLHAGWRGIANGIVEKAVDKFREHWGRPAGLMVYVGPGVRSCCYQVEADIATKIDGLSHLGKPSIDLQSVIIARLTSKGVQLKNISFSTGCTSCSVNKNNQPIYYSYRRQKEQPAPTGLFMATMKLTSPGV